MIWRNELIKTNLPAKILFNNTLVCSILPANQKPHFMKKLLTCLLAAAFAFSLVSFPSCKTSSASVPAALKFNLEEGKGYDYEIEWDIDTKGPDQQTTVRSAGLYSLDVIKSEEGVKTVSVSYKSIRLHVQSPGFEMTIDSDKPAEKYTGTDIVERIINSMTRLATRIVGKKFTLKINEEGKVLEVSGVDEMIDSMTDSSGLDQDIKNEVIASLKGQFNKGIIKEQFSQAFTIFPNKEVKVGDSWEKDISASGAMPSRYLTTYTVKAIEGNHVTLSTNTKITSKAGDSDATGTQTGEVIVDSRTGLMINANFNQHIEAQADNGTVVLTGKGKIKGKAR